VSPDLKRLPNAWFEKIQQVTKRGTPDFLGTIRGYFIALELKKDEHTHPDPLQLHLLSTIRTVGQGLTFVPHPGNWDLVYGVLQDLALGFMSPDDVKQMVEYEEICK